MMTDAMDEREALRLLAQRVPAIGDDCAVIALGETHLVFTTDMVWRESDLPAGASAHAIGWRAVAVSLSDIAAMGAEPLGVLLALGASRFEQGFMDGMLQGVLDCCGSVEAPYLGGDLSRHSGLTLVSSALGQASNPVRRSGARPGERVCVTGELGRTAASLRLFQRGEVDRANQLLEFAPRIVEGVALAPHATSMIDVSDGLARSLYQLSEAGRVGFRIRSEDAPVAPELDGLARDRQDRREMALFFGEDFELLFTLPQEHLPHAREVVRFTVIGEVVPEGVWIEERGEVRELEDRGYEH